jgi:hypothetical protein
MKKFLRHLIAMAAPAPVPIIEALAADVMDTTEATRAVDAAEEGRKEKERLRAILNSEESIGRENLSQHLAINTDLSATDAIALLAVSNREVPAVVRHAKPDDPFTRAMRTNPNFYVEQDDAPREDTATQIKRIQAAYAYASGQPIPRS